MGAFTEPLLVLDLLLRGAVLGCLALTATLVWRGHPHSGVARVGAWFAAGLACFLLTSIPGVVTPSPPAWQAPFLALAGGNSVVFWLFCRSLFDDSARLRAGHGLAWGAMLALQLWHCYGLAPGSALALDIAQAQRWLPLVFAGLAVGEAMASWSADLVEGRRRLRWFVLIGGSVYTVLGLIGGLGGARVRSAGQVLADTLLLALLVGVTAWRLLAAPPEEVLDVQALPPERDDDPRNEGSVDTVSIAPVVSPVMSPGLSPAMSQTQPGAPFGATDAAAGAANRANLAHARAHVAPAQAAPEPDPAEGPLARQLHTLMAHDRVYREEALSIGALAERLGLPEYRLRRFINQRLGQRNFNVYLNRWRLDEARGALADRALAGKSILAIALDAGFASIGPFNRAFKADAGCTPSEFRQRALTPGRAGLADSEIGHVAG